MIVDTDVPNNSKTYTFGVFLEERGSKAPRWAAYTRAFSPEWEGFVGLFRVFDFTYRKAKRKALALAKEYKSIVKEEK